MAALKCMFSTFEEINQDLETFLSYDDKQNTKILGLLQDIFKHNKKDEIFGKQRVKECPLDELDTHEGELELIWQQIQLQNEALLTQTDKKLRKMLKDKGSCLLDKNNRKSINDDVINNNNNDHQDDNDDGENVDYMINNNDDMINNDMVNDDDDMINNDDMVDDDDMINNDDLSDDDDDDIVNRNDHSKDRHMKSSIVDDQFFKLSEMEKFLEMQEKQGSDNDKAISDDENDYDLFQDYNQNKDAESRVTKENDASEYMYEDFFDTPLGVSDKTNKAKKSKKVNKEVVLGEHDVDDETSLSEEDEELVNDDQNKKSTHEKQQEKIQKKISQLQESNVALKPWQLGGETTGSVRPSNSLLEEMVYFDHTTAAAPVVTEETTQNLEDIIKQRIKDQTWDDVERKEKPVKEAYEYVKNKPVNQEKSKMSLSEIYEKEYLAQTGPSEEKQDEDHGEIKKMMSKLFTKLDALSNYHFTPKPPKTEVKIVANVSSVTIEEATPINVSNTRLLAPEEIFDKQKQELKNTTEETKEDRKQKRRIKKKKQQLAAKRRDEKSGLGNKYTKEKIKKMKEDNVEQHDSKSFTSSSAFFAKLQDSVQNEIQGKKGEAKKHKKVSIQPEQLML